MEAWRRKWRRTVVLVVVTVVLGLAVGRRQGRVEGSFARTEKVAVAGGRVEYGEDDDAPVAAVAARSRDKGCSAQVRRVMLERSMAVVAVLVSIVCNVVLPLFRCCVVRKLSSQGLGSGFQRI